jgi:hypothetical protein
MSARWATIILLLLIPGLLFSGCVSDANGPVSTTVKKNYTQVTESTGINQKYAYARSLVPLEIPGFELETRAKEPMTMWIEPYHFHSLWIPENSSEFHGPVKSLSVDAFVYKDREAGLAWLRDFETDSDGPLTIQGINTSYRSGVVARSLTTNDILSPVHVADRSSAMGSEKRLPKSSSGRN